MYHRQSMKIAAYVTELNFEPSDAYVVIDVIWCRSALEKETKECLNQNIAFAYDAIHC